LISEILIILIGAEFGLLYVGLAVGTLSLLAGVKLYNMNTKRLRIPAFGIDESSTPESRIYSMTVERLAYQTSLFCLGLSHLVGGSSHRPSAGLEVLYGIKAKVAEQINEISWSAARL
jgi:hypothetical protein